jgi:hypothetical protein
MKGICKMFMLARIKAFKLGSRLILAAIGPQSSLLSGFEDKPPVYPKRDPAAVSWEPEWLRAPELKIEKSMAGKKWL